MSPRSRRERTPEERELARLAREAKRAERGGRPPEILAQPLEPRGPAPEPDLSAESELSSESDLSPEPDLSAESELSSESDLSPESELSSESPVPVDAELPPADADASHADVPAPELAEPEPEPPAPAPGPLEGPQADRVEATEPADLVESPVSPDPAAPADPEPPADPESPADPAPLADPDPGTDPDLVQEPDAAAPSGPRRRLPHRGRPEGTGSHGAAARDLWRRRGGEGGPTRRRAVKGRPTPRRGGKGGPSRRRRFVGLLVIATVLAGAGWFLVSLFQPFKGEGEGRVLVRIPMGVGAGDVGDILQRRGVISSGLLFEVRATMGGRRGDLKPGTFRLRRDMSYSAALDALTGGPPPNVVEVTVPEGRSRREVRRTLSRSSLRGDYLAATRRSSALDPRRYGARRARNLEGFLFPDSYELKRRRPVRTLVEAQLAAFKRQFAGVDLRAARKRRLTPYDVLIVASMIEREAAIAKERPLVSSVIHNRLRKGIPLYIDATIRYAVNNWSRPLTESQLNVNSVYNTRLRKGLPPGPIGSPGLASIRAAAHPARSRFLYYVVKPNTCGEHSFAATSAEFGRDKARYDRARRARGGKSPTKC